MISAKRWWIMITLITMIGCTEDEVKAPVVTLTPLDGPVDRPSDGYGKDGMNEVEKLVFPSPTIAGRNVEIFHPKDQNGPRPTLFFSHPYGGNESIYNLGLFEFVARKGYVIVYAPYQTATGSNEERYTSLWESFKQAVTDYPELINSRKVGFIGHSFGGGATFSMAYKGFVEQGWGQEGRMIFCMAPWYVLNISQEQLGNFPENTSLVMEVYENDQVNDQRMAIDLYKNISIPNDLKDYILVRESVVDGYTYIAEHDLPDTREFFDAYDYYTVYRLLDAQMDFCFNGSSKGKQVALGNGSAEQVTMPCTDGGCLNDLEVTDNPQPIHAQDFYRFSCDSGTNQRIAYCQ